MEHGTHLCSFIASAEVCAEYPKPAAPAAFFVGPGATFTFVVVPFQLNCCRVRGKVKKKRKYNCLSKYPKVFRYKNALIFENLTITLRIHLKMGKKGKKVGMQLLRLTLVRL